MSTDSLLSITENCESEDEKYNLKYISGNQKSRNQDKKSRYSNMAYIA